MPDVMPRRQSNESNEDSTGHVQVDRLQLARALIEHDQESTTPRRELALSSAVLSPFRHLLSRQRDDSPSTEDLSDSASANTSTRRPTSTDWSLRSVRPSLSASDIQRRYLESIARPLDDKAETWEDDDGEERLAESPLARGGESVSESDGRSLSLKEDQPWRQQKLDDRLETRSLPDLLDSQTTSDEVRVDVTTNDQVRSRTRSLGSVSLLDLPIFQPFLSSEALSDPSERFVGDDDDGLHHATSSRPASRMSIGTTSTAFDRTQPPPERPSSAFSMATSTFTSRLDPTAIALAREELEADRPRFKTPCGPPTLVVLPAPLAGRPESPVKRQRFEGPDDGIQLEEAEVVDEAAAAEGEESSIMPRVMRHPPGALYGRSLMDVLAERKALLKAQQRSSPATGSTVVKGAAPSGEEGAGGMPRSRTAMSGLLGPDLVFQRDLERRRIEEEAEAKAKAEEDEAEQVKKEAERLRQEAKLLKKRKHLARDAAARKLEGERTLEVKPASAKPEGDRLDPTSAPLAEVVLSPKATPTRRSHAPAPSLSLPAGFETDVANPEPWFETFASPTSSTSSFELVAQPSKWPPHSRRPSSGWDLDLTGPVSPIETEDLQTRPHATESVREPPRVDHHPRASPLSPPRLQLDTGDASLGLPFTVEPSVSSPRAIPRPPLEQGEEDDEDDLPLGVRFQNGGALDEDDVPLGLRRLALPITTTKGQDNSDDDDDKPLGLRFAPSSSSVNVAAYQQHHAMLLQAQQQQQQAMAAAAHAQQMAVMQTMMLHHHHVSSGDLSVDKWRHSVK